MPPHNPHGASDFEHFPVPQGSLPQESNHTLRTSDAADEGAPDSLGHVLVVDDDPLVRRLLRVTLADEGYDVALAEDGEEALRVAAEEPVDAIVLDLEMPRLDGRAAFRKLREQGVDAPVLVLSANGAHAAKRELSADAALEKPFEPFELVRRIERLLRRRHNEGMAFAGD